MNWEREYIIQAYENAANNLRLVSNRLINHNLLREFLLDCSRLDDAVTIMKTVTEFAKFAVKFGNVINFTHTIPDFINLSSSMQHQVNDLIPVVREILDAYSPEVFSKKLEEIKAKLHGEENFSTSGDIDEILNLVREIDDYLVLCAKGEISTDEKEKFIEIINRTNALLNNFDSELVNEMKNILYELFNEVIQRGEAKPEEIEAMRACLIVIVAKVKNKDVDVSQFVELARNAIVRKEEE